MSCLLDDTTLFLTSIYHDIAPNDVANIEQKLGDFLIQTTIDINSTDRDTWDGNLLVKLNEVIHDRYRVIDILKYGTTSCVYKCQDLENPTKFYTVKVLKLNMESESNEYHSLSVLSSGSNSSIGRDHVDYQIDSFHYNGHRCFVKPLLAHSIVDSFHSNLPLLQLLKTIQDYLTQILQAISYIHSCNIIHGDIKPDNILFTDETMKSIRLIDFGSSNQSPSVSAQFTQSRYYRSPEVILELPCNELIDVWSVGCIACELFLEFPPFACETDFDCLHAMVALIGQIDPEIPPLSSIWWKFFDVSPRGFSLKVDPSSVLRENHVYKSVFEKAPENYNLIDFIRHHRVAKTAEEVNRVRSFSDLVMRMLSIDPEKRISASQALQHPFMTGELFNEDWNPPFEKRDSVLHKVVSEPEFISEKPAYSAVTPSTVSSEINENEFLSMF